MKWANVGVGRLQHPHALRLCLLGAAGQPAFAADAKADPRDWLPGEHNLAESLLVPRALAVGRYTVAVRLGDPDGQGRPFRLAIDVPEQEGRYELSTLKVD